ncbi:MAG: hypothetical protein ABFD46_08475 [Armatimonadota bacterium]
MNSNTIKSMYIVLIIAVLTLAAGYAQAATAKTSEGIAFRFNPPDGITFTETGKHTTKEYFYGIASKPVVITTKARITIKKTDKGYRASRIPLYYNVEGNSSTNKSTTTDAILKYLDCTVLEYELNKDGECIGILGLEKLIDDIEIEVRKVAPPGMQLNPEVLMSMIASVESIEAVRWNEKFGYMTGYYMNVGESIKTSTPQELPHSGDLVKANCVIKLSELVKKGGKELAKIQYSSSLDNEALSDWYNKSGAFMIGSNSGASYEAMEVSSAERKDKIEHTIYLSTQLPYFISSKSTMKVVGSISDTSNIRYSYEEWEQYTYDYSK